MNISKNKPKTSITLEDDPLSIIEIAEELSKDGNHTKDKIIDHFLRMGYKEELPIYACFDDCGIVEGKYSHELPGRACFGLTVLRKDINIKKTYNICDLVSFRKTCNSIQESVSKNDLNAIKLLGSPLLGLVYGRIFDNSCFHDISPNFCNNIFGDIKIRYDELQIYEKDQITLNYYDNSSEKMHPKALKQNKDYFIIFVPSDTEEHFIVIGIYNLEKYSVNGCFEVKREINIKGFNSYYSKGFEQLKKEDVFKLWKNKSQIVEYLAPNKKSYFKCLVYDDAQKLPIIEIGDLMILPEDKRKFEEEYLNAQKTDINTDSHGLKKQLSEAGKKGGRTSKHDVYFQAFIDNIVRNGKKQKDLLEELGDFTFESHPRSDDELYPTGFDESCDDVFILESKKEGSRIYYTSHSKEKHFKLGNLKNFFTRANKKILNKE